jgi:S1-C subfamily serine protease
VLRVPALASVGSLRLRASAPVGTSAAVLGFPENGPFDVRPARLGPTSTVVTQDAYGRGPTRRRVTALRGLVRSGNSGGPLVDGQGRVVGTVFAATRSAGQRGGFAVPNSVVQAALGRVRGGVDTGPCAS